MRWLKTDVKAELNSGMVELPLAPDQDPSSSDTDDHKENYPLYSTPAVPRLACNPTVMPQLCYLTSLPVISSLCCTHKSVSLGASLFQALANT
jgi:hypothetical protein